MTFNFFKLSDLFGLVTIAIISQMAAVEVPAIGTCPRVNVIKNFDLTRFFGRW